MSKLARSLNTAEKHALRLRHWDCVRVSYPGVIGRDPARRERLRGMIIQMNDDEIIRQPIDTRSAACVHRGPPIPLIVGSWRGQADGRRRAGCNSDGRFEDGKALRPEVNIAKMHAGILLIRRLAGALKIDESTTLASAP